MKKKGHPKYQDILFEDTASGFKFVCGSTLNPKEKAVFEGKEYPVYRVAISSASHPFFVGGKSYVDTEGRVEKFTKKYKKKIEENKKVKNNLEKKEKEEEEPKVKSEKEKKKKVASTKVLSKEKKEKIKKQVKKTVKSESKKKEVKKSKNTKPSSKKVSSKDEE